MHIDIPSEIALIAGRGVYPLILAESARQQGVKRIFALAFKGETERSLARHVDRIEWVRLGLLERAIEILRQSGARHAVMAGQIKPTHLFNLRFDKRMLALLARLPVRNADTIYGALAEELRTLDIELLPAHRFMESTMPAPGTLTRRAPTEAERHDIALGLRAAKLTSGLDIGQTVVVKQGTILAVEAFEGTNETLQRAFRLGREGCVIVKVAKRGHDTRFDIPVVGMQTMKMLHKGRAAVLAVEAGRTILLEREKLVAAADASGICIEAVRTDDESFA